MNRLAELRKSKGISQEQLAKDIGVSPSTIAMYEINERTPSLRMAKALADYFEVPIEYIFFGINAHVMRADDNQAATKDQETA